MFILLDVFHCIYFISPDVFAYFTVLGDEKILLSTDQGKILLLTPRLEVRHQLFFCSWVVWVEEEKVGQSATPWGSKGWMVFLCAGWRKRRGEYGISGG